MSSFVYPATLPGLTYNNLRTPIWNTGLQEALSGKESRIAYRRYPLYRFELQYEFLRNNVTPNDLKALWGLFNAVQGKYDTFLYTDPHFNSVTNEPFGTGDGSTHDFQLVATYQNAGGPGISEIIQNLNGSPVIKDNGVTKTLTTDYTLGPTGLVHFITAPTSGHALTWTGSFYYRCRFDDDEMPLMQFMSQLWKTQTVVLRTIKL
ncbi:MAG TPA: DUF2460 domain-containing protein [Burkholderiales bacterium]|nr:DUF2460 domain-containing protein [Burkholderiales bacterium]